MEPGQAIFIPIQISGLKIMILGLTGLISGISGWIEASGKRGKEVKMNVHIIVREYEIQEKITFFKISLLLPDKHVSRA